jgi:hypothetical protein
MTNNSKTKHRRPSQGGRFAWLLTAAMFVGSMCAAAQTSTTGTGTAGNASSSNAATATTEDSSMTNSEENGRIWNGYEVKQSIEFGGRITDVEGNGGVYNTFVNLRSGPRLLDYSLSLHSVNHMSALFDELSFSNSGYGGDPNSVSRLRVSKNRWYDFGAQFRRDINYYNYSAFANPYNWGRTAAATTAPTVIQWNNSIHEFNTRRKMGDFNLTLAPQSPIRVRLGYSRNLNDGPTWSSYHEGTDVQLFQNFSNRQDQYQIGVDFKIAPRTTLSYDQFFVHGDVNTYWQDTNVGNATIAGGTPPVSGAVDIGAIWNPYYGQPCATAAVTGGVLTPPTCGVYGGYLRTGPVKTNLPTEQLSFISNYFNRVDFNGSFSYTSGDSVIDNYNETANTWVTRTNELAYQFTGPTKARRISSHGDLGFTIHLTESVAVSNTTRFLNYRHPGSWNSTEVACFPNVFPSTGVTVLSPVGVPVGGDATCAGRPASGTPQHTSGSPADLTNELFIRQFAERQVFNTSELEWQPSKRFGGHLGYRFGNVRTNYTDWDSASATYLGVNAGVGNTRLAPGTYVTAAPASLAEATLADVETTEHALLAGVVLRPLNNWRVNADVDYAYDTVALTPLWPQHSLRAKVRTTYRLNSLASITASYLSVNNRNDVRPTGPEGLIAFPTGVDAPRHRDNTRSLNVGFTIDPIKQFSLDFGYTYNKVFSTTGSCLMVSGGPTGLVPQGGPITRCGNVILNAGGEPTTTAGGSAIPAILDYDQNVHNLYTSLTLRPVNRVAITVGYDYVVDGGDNDWLRADTRALLRVPVDIAGNVVYTGNLFAGPVVDYAPGPNPFQPIGTLDMSWHRPSASIELGLSKSLSFKGAYNYYDYKENGYQGPSGLSAITPRNFTANVGTLSLRYAF